MRETETGLYAVVTADVVASTAVPQFTKLRDRKLGKLSAAHLDQGLVLQPYTVTTWDEFQSVLAGPWCAPQVIWDLRRIWHPMPLRIAVGIGTIIEPLRTPINAFAGGQAFEFAREALDEMRGGKVQRFQRFTQFRSVNSSFDQIANLIYGLHDTLLKKVTAKQWENINTYVGTGSQDVTARRLNVGRSTVSRNLQRGSYWHMKETVEVVRGILKDLFSPAIADGTLRRGPQVLRRIPEHSPGVAQKRTRARNRT
jgi:hypothetical protein